MYTKYEKIKDWNNNVTSTRNEEGEYDSKERERKGALESDEIHNDEQTLRKQVNPRNNTYENPSELD